MYFCTPLSWNCKIQAPTLLYPLFPYNALVQQVAKLAGRNLGPGNARRLNGQSSSLGLLPPTDFGGTLRSSDACGKPQSVYGGNLPQSPQRGEPQRQIPLSGNPFGFARCLRRETLPQHWSHLLQDWLPPGSPVAYGGKPACSTGFTARRCSPLRQLLARRWLDFAGNLACALAPLTFLHPKFLTHFELNECMFRHTLVTFGAFGLISNQR